ncbi:hypothetical protein JHK82_015368 [Glycine max]|nr:hypothetical protein JHK82_015368 [Glycine max]
MINLLEVSNPTKNSPICVYVLHLVELSGRTSAILIVHNTAKQDAPVLNRTEAQSDHIIKAFENYEQHASYISVQPLTAISLAAIGTMDDIHDLFIVGRGQGVISPLTAGLTDWSECPEIGAIGDMLASSDFAATASVLVLQQYVGDGSPCEGLETPNAEEHITGISHSSTPPPSGHKMFNSDR